MGDSIVATSFATKICGRRSLLGNIISPPGNDSFRADLRFTRDVLFFQREISEMRGPTGVKFCTVVNTRLNFLFYNAGPKFRGSSIKKI